MLPLDLHVLSLPLAFILSQDQTLHCSIDNQSDIFHIDLLINSISLFVMGFLSINKNWFSFITGDIVIGFNIKQPNHQIKKLPNLR
jgi:hypothetical protein